RALLGWADAACDAGPDAQAGAETDGARPMPLADLLAGLPAADAARFEDGLAAGRGSLQTTFTPRAVAGRSPPAPPLLLRRCAPPRPAGPRVPGTVVSAAAAASATSVGPPPAPADGQGPPGIDITEHVEPRQRAEQATRRFELAARAAGVGYWTHQ